MAKVNLYKLIKSLDSNDFKKRLRDSLQGLAPDVKLGMDDVFSALLNELKGYYSTHSVEVSDDSVIEWQGK